MSLIKNNRGMTLVEVLVAIAIFAVAAIPLIGVFYNSTITNSMAKIKTQEATIAQNVVENLKAGSIKTNEDIQKFMQKLIQEGYYLNISRDENNNTNLAKYKIQIAKINSNLPPYTIYAVAPATDITSYTPPIIPPGGGHGGGGNDDIINAIFSWITIAIVAIWAVFFVIFVVIPAKGLFAIFVIPQIITTIVNSIKSGIKDLKTIATNIANSIGLSIPGWLRWW